MKTEFNINIDLIEDSANCVLYSFRDEDDKKLVESIIQKDNITTIEQLVKLLMELSHEGSL